MEVRFEEEKSAPATRIPSRFPPAAKALKAGPASNSAKREKSAVSLSGKLPALSTPASSVSMRPSRSHRSRLEELRNHVNAAVLPILKAQQHQQKQERTAALPVNLRAGFDDDDFRGQVIGIDGISTNSTTRSPILLQSGTVGGRIVSSTISSTRPKKDQVHAI